MRKYTNIMGIINLNNDSFYRQSRVKNQSEFQNRVAQMFYDGADIIDIGACSSRPGSVYEGEEVEWQRLEPALRVISNLFTGKNFSIDTFSSSIVKKAYDIIGPFMVNDISASEADSEMLNTVAELGLQYVAMHKRGNGVTMDNLCQYDDVVEEVKSYFRHFAQKAADYGVNNWILDPGFGFAKTNEQNFEMLAKLSEFSSFGKPILVGISRKRMVWEPLGLSPETCLIENLRLQGQAAISGASYLRVHDVGAFADYLATIH